MSTVLEKPATLAAFVNEPVSDFTRSEDQEAARAAAKVVQAQLGREYELSIAGRQYKTAAKLESLNPSRPDEVVGIHQMATAEMANQAIETAFEFFPEWSLTPAHERIAMTLRAAEIIRKRKREFDAWLVFEAGKTWPEADGDVSEAIDFLEFYARQMERLSRPDPLVQMPGEHDEMVYLPLGVGRHHSAVEFPTRHHGGHEHRRPGDRQHDRD